MVKLFSPFHLREINFKNRIFVSPMCQYSATDGVPDAWHLVHLGSRAVGGAALVMTEATAVCAEGRISPGDLGLYNDAQLNAFKPIVAFISRQGAVPAIQLAHAGRKGSTPAPFADPTPLSGPAAWTPTAPSALRFSPTYPLPKEMTLTDIDQTVRDFASAAKRARDAGFQVIEIHAAHGYLLHEFLSPLTNHRTDDYGGSLANRMRLPLRVAKSLRELWPAEWPVFVRVSASDWVDGGWDIDQTVEFAKELKKLGLDFIDCSSGGAVPDAKITVGPGYQVPFARAVRERAGLATGAVGMISTPEQAEAILADGHADVVLLARKLLDDPYWPLHAAEKLGVDVSWPKQYVRAKKTK